MKGMACSKRFMENFRRFVNEGKTIEELIDIYCMSKQEIYALKRALVLEDKLASKINFTLQPTHYMKLAEIKEEKGLDLAVDEVKKTIEINQKNGKKLRHAPITVQQIQHITTRVRCGLACSVERDLKKYAGERPEWLLPEELRAYHIILESPWWQRSFEGKTDEEFLEYVKQYILKEREERKEIRIHNYFSGLTDEQIQGYVKKVSVDIQPRVQKIAQSILKNREWVRIVENRRNEFRKQFDILKEKVSQIILVLNDGTQLSLKSEELKIQPYPTMRNPNVDLHLDNVLAAYLRKALGYDETGYFVSTNGKYCLSCEVSE